MSAQASPLETDIALLEKFEIPAARHVASSRGNLELLKINPEDTENFPGQVGVVIRGQQTSVDFLKNIGDLVIPGFAGVTRDMYDSNPEAVEKTGSILDEGGNVVIATSHKGLIDPAMALGALYLELKDRGHDFKTGINISKMLSRLAYRIDGQPVPTVGVLKLICDYTYLTIPATKSTREALDGDEMPAKIKTDNEQAVSAMKQQLKQGRLLMAMSPSGTTDKIKDGKQILAQLNDKTIDIMADDNTYVLPMAVDLSGEQPFIDVCGDPQQLQEPADAHGLMKVIADRLNDRVKGMKFEYLGPNLGLTAEA